MAVSAKITEQSKELVDEIAILTGETRMSIIEKAMINYKRQIDMKQFDEDYARLRSNEQLWKEELREREELDGTLEDGLSDE